MVVGLTNSRLRVLDEGLFMSNKPTFLGVGAMKSATTWLSECLRYHPEVYVSDVKEIHFFSRNWDKGFEWYCGHFNGVKQQKVIGEFSNTYVDDVEFCSRIKEKLGNIKIIICLRDPIDRLVSHYKYNYRVYPEAKNLPMKDIDVRMLEIISKEFPELLSRGLYTKAVRDYIDYFGRSNVLITFKEDIDESPKNELKRLYRFLEVDEAFEPDILNKKVSPGSVPRVFVLEKMRVRIYQIMHSVFPRVIVWVRRARVGELYRKLNKSNVTIGVTNDGRKWLKSYYKADVLSLEALTEKNLEKIWGSYPG